jgi:hypothetical protein
MSAREGHQWAASIKAHFAALFQTALLLSADETIAESAILDALASLELSWPPPPDQLAVLQQAVVKHTLKLITFGPQTVTTDVRALLQRGLQRVLDLDQLPRICFVLCLLLRYTTSSCAHILEIREEMVREQISVAARELHVLCTEIRTTQQTTLITK